VKIGVYISASESLIFIFCSDCHTAESKKKTYLRSFNGSHNNTAHLKLWKYFFLSDLNSNTHSKHSHLSIRNWWNNVCKKTQTYWTDQKSPTQTTNSKFFAHSHRNFRLVFPTRKLWLSFCRGTWWFYDALDLPVVYQTPAKHFDQAVNKYDKSCSNFTNSNIQNNNGVGEYGWLWALGSNHRHPTLWKNQWL